MKAAPETGPNRSGTRYSAADKLKAVKLYLEEGYQAKDIARELGIGKSSLGKWIREYREKGSGAFTSPPEKSAAAAEKSDPAREFVRAQILEHKAAHPDHGVKRITQIFRRFLGLPVKTHEVRAVLQAHPSSSTATTSRPRRPPAPMRFFERRSPNELWHTDVMYFIMLNHEKVFVIGYLDDYSRYVVALDLFHRQTVGNTIDLLKKACGDYTFPKEILTDGGRQFVSWTGNNQFGTYLRNHQIKHTVCRTHHPQTNGKMERFWRTLRQEFFDKAKISSFDELRELLALYVRHYNFQRPHQGIGGVAPADRFFEIETAVKRQLAEKIAENSLELALKGHLRKPFMMIGRVGDSCVSILEKKGRISMQIDGVEQPTGETPSLVIPMKTSRNSLTNNHSWRILKMEKPHPRAVENPEKSAMTESPTQPLTAQEKCKAVLSVWTEKTSVSAVCRRYSVRPPQVERWEFLALEGMLKALEARPRGCKAFEMKENSLSTHLEKLLDRKMLQNGKRQVKKKEENQAGPHLEKLPERPGCRVRAPKTGNRGQSLPSAEISQ